MLLAVLAFLFASSCTDPIDVDLNFDNAQLVVDAWVDDQAKDQIIRLTLTQQYDNSARAEGVPGATVEVVEGSNVYEFVDQGNGDYKWSSDGTTTLGEVGDVFVLKINADGNLYEGTTSMYRVPEIDSITTEERKDEIGFADGIYAQLYARDLPGIGDTYWARTYKNGIFLNKPAELFPIYDATFSPGSSLDGITFIPPIRELINPIPDAPENGEDVPSPYKVGDEIRVELMSISNEAYEFLSIAFEQMTNGTNTIFALPIANTRSNVFNIITGERMIGFFNVGSTSVETILVE